MQAQQVQVCVCVFVCVLCCVFLQYIAPKWTMFLCIITVLSAYVLDSYCTYVHYTVSIWLYPTHICTIPTAVLHKCTEYITYSHSLASSVAYRSIRTYKYTYTPCLCTRAALQEKIEEEALQYNMFHKISRWSERSRGSGQSSDCVLNGCVLVYSLAMAIMWFTVLLNVQMYSVAGSVSLFHLCVVCGRVWRDSARHKDSPPPTPGWPSGSEWLPVVLLTYVHTYVHAYISLGVQLVKGPKHNGIEWLYICMWMIRHTRKALFATLHMFIMHVGYTALWYQLEGGWKFCHPPPAGTREPCVVRTCSASWEAPTLCPSRSSSVTCIGVLVWPKAFYYQLTVRIYMYVACFLVG